VTWWDVAIRIPQNLRILYVLPTKTEHFGERIPTPVFPLARNDRFFNTLKHAFGVLFYTRASEAYTGCGRLYAQESPVD